MLPGISKLGEVLQALQEVLEGFDQARSRYWTIRIFCQSPRDLRVALYVQSLSNFGANHGN